MKRKGMFEIGMLSLACLGMILPTPILQAAGAGQTSGPRSVGPSSLSSVESALVGIDVALRPNGVLLGQVVDWTGKPMVGAPVSLRQRGREVAATRTDQSGHFLVKGLRGGTYEIVAGPTRGIYRIWAPSLAPPSAQPTAVVTVGGRQVRGQGGPIGYWLQNPWVVAGLVAAAVAIPVAIHNHRIDRTASP